MDPSLSEFAKFGLAGLLCGVIVGMTLFLLRWVTARADKTADDASKNAIADMAWLRAEITTSRTEFLAALRDERITREKHSEALLSVLRADHKEAMEELAGIRNGVERLTIRVAAAPGAPQQTHLS